MADAYIGVSNVARKISNIYIGVDGKARKVKKGWIGVGGVAREFISSGLPPVLDPLNVGRFYPSASTSRTSGNAFILGGIIEGGIGGDVTATSNMIKEDGSISSISDVPISSWQSYSSTSSCEFIDGYIGFIGCHSSTATTSMPCRIYSPIGTASTFILRISNAANAIRANKCITISDGSIFVSLDTSSPIETEGLYKISSDRLSTTKISSATSDKFNSGCAWKNGGVITAVVTNASNSFYIYDANGVRSASSVRSSVSALSSKRNMHPTADGNIICISINNSSPYNAVCELITGSESGSITILSPPTLSAINPGNINLTNMASTKDGGVVFHSAYGTASNIVNIYSPSGIKTTKDINTAVNFPGVTRISDGVIFAGGTTDSSYTLTGAVQYLSV